MRIPYTLGAVSIYKTSAFSFNSFHNSFRKEIGRRGDVARDIINYVKRIGENDLYAIHKRIKRDDRA